MDSNPPPPVHPITHYKINSISPVYTNINTFFEIPTNYYKGYKIRYANRDKYRIIQLVGGGKYSDVFVGHYSHGTCAIKVLKSVLFWKVQKELYILDKVRKVPNVVKVLDVARDPESDIISIITEYCAFDDWKILFPTLQLNDIRFYMYSLLKALDGIHSRGVMHRDVKPLNFLINHSKKQCLLIDFGLADLYYPRHQYSVRVATLRYKSPELLFNYHFYDYSLDIWGAGCILAEMLIHPQFIKGVTPAEVVSSIGKIWGNKILSSYVDKYGIELLPELITAFPKNENPTWDDIIGETRPMYRSAEAFDLLQKLLTVDHNERITARDALRHPFFQPLFS